MSFPRLALLVLAVLFGSGLPVPADAAWGALVSLGPNKLFSDPVCAADAAGSAVCVASIADSRIAANRYAQGKWGGWKALAGVVDGKASCARIAAGRVLCGVRNGDDALAAYIFSAGSWTGPQLVGGVLSSDPSCAALAADHAVCAGLGSVSSAGTSTIYSAAYNGSTWKVLPTQTTVSFSSVSCAPDDRGHAICVWTGAAHHVMAGQFNGVEWLEMLDLGGRAFGQPACLDTGLPNGAVICYGVGGGGAGYYDTYFGTFWGLAGWTGQWLSFGGTMTSVSCAQNGSHDTAVSTACAAAGVTPPAGVKYGQLWGYGAGSVGGANSWLPLGGQVIGVPSCIALNTTVSPGRVMCVTQTVANTAASVVGP